jgi:hypothetical protein
MPVEELRERLGVCAAEMERGIDAWRKQKAADRVSFPHVLSDIPDEAMVDTQGRPILAGLYAELAAVYVALADMGGTR